MTLFADSAHGIPGNEVLLNSSIARSSSAPDAFGIPGRTGNLLGCCLHDAVVEENRMAALKRSTGILLLFAVPVGMLSGCGDDPPPPAPQPPPVVARKPVGFAPRRKVEEKPKGIDLSEVDPDSIFEKAETPLPNYLALGPVPSKPEDRFVAEAALPGRDSSNFVATPPESESSSPSRVFSLPQGFAAIESAPFVAGMPTRIRCVTDGATMVLIPGGEAVIGTSTGPQHWGPPVRLTLDPFYIAEHEVTVARYMQCRQKAGVVGKKMEPPLNSDGPSDAPAVGITWGEARTYAQWIGGSLPTEAQWEKAARGPQGLQSPWGNSRPLWRTPRTLEQIDSIGRHPDDRSVFGVFDMAGNAREWVADFFREDSLQTLLEMPGERRRNWSGPRNSPANQRVVKGNGPDWTVYNREGVRMNDRVDRVGFRCVVNLTAVSRAAN